MYISRTDGFVGFLCPFGFGLVPAEPVVLLTPMFGYFLFECTEGHIRQIHRVCTHIGDKPFFVQLLSDTHGLCHTVAEFPGCFLLERRGSKRSGRRTFARTLRNVRYMKVGIHTLLQEISGFLLRLESFLQFRRQHSTVG